MNRVYHEPAYVLHKRLYRESSALVEMLTMNHGRIALVYKGAYRNGKRLPSLRQFCELRASWSGRGDLYNLIDLEMKYDYSAPGSIQAVCGLYVNELVINLIPRHIPATALYQSYETALISIKAESSDLELVLRQFESALLSAIGYGLQLECEGNSGHSIDPHSRYYYDNERGPVRCDNVESGRCTISGRTLKALQQWQDLDLQMMREIKGLFRNVIDYHLNGKLLETRKLIKYLHQ